MLPARLDLFGRKDDEQKMNIEQASQLGWQLLSEHGLARNGWQFRWSNSKVVFGICRYSRRYIELSRPLTELNTETHVRDTILHEIAHALAGDVGHSAKWKAQAKTIGARPERYYRASDVVMPKARYEAVCPKCKQVKSRYRKPKYTSACKACCKRYSHGFFDAAFILNFVATDAQ